MKRSRDDEEITVLSGPWRIIEAGSDEAGRALYCLGLMCSASLSFRAGKADVCVGDTSAKSLSQLIWGKGNTWDDNSYWLSFSFSVFTIWPLWRPLRLKR